LKVGDSAPPLVSFDRVVQILMIFNDTYEPKIISPQIMENNQLFLAYIYMKTIQNRVFYHHHTHNCGEIIFGSYVSIKIKKIL